MSYLFIFKNNTEIKGLRIRNGMIPICLHSSQIVLINNLLAFADNTARLIDETLGHEIETERLKLSRDAECTRFAFSKCFIQDNISLNQ